MNERMTQPTNSYAWFLEPLEYLDARVIYAHRAGNGRFWVNVEWLNECVHVRRRMLAYLRSRFAIVRKQFPGGVFILPLSVPEEHLVCRPFGLIIVFWDRHGSPSVYCQTAAANGEIKNEAGKCLLSRYGNFPKDIFLCERWEEGGKVGDMSFQTCQRHKPTKLCCCFHKCLISFIILWLRLNKCESFEELFTGGKVITSTSVFPVI